MEVRIITLRYSPELGAIDDAPLLALGRDHEVLGVREHFFMVHEVPHLLCVVSCQRRASIRAATPSTEPTTVASPPIATDPTPTTTSTTTATSASTSTTDRSSSRSGPAADLTADQRCLYDAIRRWRVTQAERDGVPRYVVLTNRDVDALVRARPQSLTDLRRVPGIGKTKAERYGQTILGLLHPGRPAATPKLVVESPDEASPKASSDPGGDPASVEPAEPSPGNASGSDRVSAEPAAPNTGNSAGDPTALEPALATATTDCDQAVTP